MLILEGSDDLGKTTAAKRLVHLAAERAEVEERNACKYPIRYEHMTRPNSGFDFYRDYMDMVSMFAVADRFHIGGMVWHDAIPYNKLKLIESWLAAVGSFTVLFVSDDPDWYLQRLEQNKRKQMFDIETLMQANSTYLDMALGAFKFPVHHDHVIFVNHGWPDDNALNITLDSWFDLLEPLERT